MSHHIFFKTCFLLTYRLSGISCLGSTLSISLKINSCILDRIRSFRTGGISFIYGNRLSKNSKSSLFSLAHSFSRISSLFFSISNSIWLLSSALRFFFSGAVWLVSSESEISLFSCNGISSIIDSLSMSSSMVKPLSDAVPWPCKNTSWS